MNPKVWVSKLVFSDDSELSPESDDIIVIVGPNNAGKSATLRDVFSLADDMNYRGPVIKSLQLGKIGEVSDVKGWLFGNFSVKVLADKYYVDVNDEYDNVEISMGLHEWTSDSMGGLSSLFLNRLHAGDRIQGADPVKNIGVTAIPLLPLHYLVTDETMEEKLSDRFREAFGADLIVHRASGEMVHLRCGDRPKPASGQDRSSRGFALELEKLPPLHQQGDGMKSFAAILLGVSVGPSSVLLVDEPEAFLHPPQARLLGRMLARDKREGCQLFVATHSGDVLRGMLDSGHRGVRIIRLQRSGNINHTRELSQLDLNRYWSDPLMRYSNILDGIFHEKVILCESDADSRFYSAVLDTVFDMRGTRARRPDVMFTQCGGKDRLPLAIKSLRQLGVPVAAVADFDVLSDGEKLRQIIDAFGENWSDFAPDWKIVSDQLGNQKSELNPAEVKEKIESILSGVSGSTFPERARRDIAEVLRRSSPWSLAKKAGTSFVPSGDATKANNRLLARLKSIGLYVVPVGEQEGFVREVGGHGPSWVNQVLESVDLQGEQLAMARAFVESLLE